MYIVQSHDFCKTNNICIHSINNNLEKSIKNYNLIVDEYKTYNLLEENCKIIELIEVNNLDYFDIDGFMLFQNNNDNNIKTILNNLNDDYMNTE